MSTNGVGVEAEPQAGVGGKPEAEVEAKLVAEVAAEVEAFLLLLSSGVGMQTKRHYSPVYLRTLRQSRLSDSRPSDLLVNVGF